MLNENTASKLTGSCGSIKSHGGGMGGLLKDRRQSKPVDLITNPFFTFGLDPSASLDKLGDAFEDALADRAASETELHPVLLTPA